MSLPIIRDKSHDPFIIFGGIFSRDLIEAELAADNRKSDEEALARLRHFHSIASNRFSSENALRQEIAQTLLEGITCVLPENSVRDIIYEKTIVETKNAVDEWSLDVLKGSKKIGKGLRVETAEEELFRYLAEHRDYSWGVLTNGRIFRIYHRTADTNYIEFDLFDIAKSGAVAHASLLLSLLRDCSLRDRLLEETLNIREEQIERKLQERILLFLKTATGDRTDQLYSLIFFLTIRYLEDIGILPNNSTEYQRFSLRTKDNYSIERLRAVIHAFIDGRWFRGECQDIFSDDEIAKVESFIERPSNRSALQKLVFGDGNRPFNLSDIYIDHLGNIYQVAISKHSEGAYYTPHTVGIKLADYLRQLNYSQREKFGQDSSKVIIDPACGSGQLLRVLIPHAHNFHSTGGQYVPKNSIRRSFISKLVGIDKDPVSVFICKVGLGLMGAEAGSGLAKPRLMKQEDTLEAFLDSRRNFSDIPREDIFAIVTNPPWESLEFQVGNLFRKITGKTIPKKNTLNSPDQAKRREAQRQVQEFEEWIRSGNGEIEAERMRLERLTKVCDDIAEDHKDHFSGKKNLALYFIFVINKLLEKSNGSYIVVMPDRFFVGEDCPVRDRLFQEFEAYAPFQDCGRIFEGVDNGTRFGIVFGRKGINRPKLGIQIPIVENGIPKDFISTEISKSDLRVQAALFDNQGSYILPFFRSKDDIDLLSRWMTSRTPMTTWQQGRINLGGRGSSESDDYGSVGGPEKFDYNVIKSKQRKTSSDETLKGVFDVEFGCTIKKIPDRLKQHYAAEKVVVPNVKRNGVRKVIVGLAKNCLVEHDYNFTSELGKADLSWLRSCVYNYLCGILAGSYHINAALLNFIGQPSFKVSGSAHWIDVEIQILESIGIALQDAVRIFATTLLSEYPDAFIADVYGYLAKEYEVQFAELEPEELLVPFEIQKKKKGKVGAVKLEEDPVGRAQLAAYIVNKLADEPTFGRTKLEKLIYLFDARGVFPVGGAYQRMAAGPMDTTALFDRSSGIEALGVQFGMFSVQTLKVRVGESREVGSKVRYGRGDEIDSAVRAAEKVLEKKGSKIHADNLIDFFRSLPTEQTEAIATLYAAWNDLLAAGKKATVKEIVAEVRQKWFKGKEKFSAARLERELELMISKRLIPSGSKVVTS